MVSSAILCLLYSARDVSAAEGLLSGVAAGEGNLFGERLPRRVESPKDRAVVEVGTDPDADSTDDGRIDIDLQRHLPVVHVGQFGGQRLLLRVTDRLGHRHVCDLTVPFRGG